MYFFEFTFEATAFDLINVTLLLSSGDLGEHSSFVIT